MTGQPLTDDERRMLALEKKMPRPSGPKDAAIYEVFGVSPTRYHQILLALIDCREALEYDPMLVLRLRRLRDSRRRARRAVS
jgi:hypothetical protein